MGPPTCSASEGTRLEWAYPRCSGGACLPGRRCLVLAAVVLCVHVEVLGYSRLEALLPGSLCSWAPLWLGWTVFGIKCSWDLAYLEAGVDGFTDGWLGSCCSDDWVGLAPRVMASPSVTASGPLGHLVCSRRRGKIACDRRRGTHRVRVHLTAPLASASWKICRRKKQ